MDPIFDVAVPLGPRKESGRSLEDIAQRVHMVLDTRPGQLPWRKDFGCDLEATTGESVTEARLSNIRWQIEQTIMRWIPEVNLVKRVEIDLVRDEGMGIDVADRRIPLAEAAMVRFGVQCSLQVRIDLETKEGPLSLQAHVAE